MKPPRDYFDLLDAIHRITVPRTYVEIGVASGKSLSLALPGTTLIGIDPAANIRHPVSGTLHVFHETSDDFFAAGMLRHVPGGLPVDVAFIDGLHHFDAVLRDFRNLEEVSSEESVILIHDCVPPENQIASRERDTCLWTGDVWKAIIGLRQHRPDLTISVLDVSPTGVAVVTGLRPRSRVLFERYDEICATLAQLSLPDSTAARRALLGVTPFDWVALESQLPSHPFRAEPVGHLLRQRRLRMPSPEYVFWRLRRVIRYSPVGRHVLPLRYSAPLPVEGASSSHNRAGLD